MIVNCRNTKFYECGLWEMKEIHPLDFFDERPITLIY